MASTGANDSNENVIMAKKKYNRIDGMVEIILVAVLVFDDTLVDVVAAAVVVVVVAGPSLDPPR